MVYVITSLYRISAESSYDQQQPNFDNKHNENQYQQLKQDSQQSNLRIEQNKPEPYIKISAIHFKNTLKKSSQHHINIHKTSSVQYEYEQIIQPKYSLSDYNQYKGKIIQAEQYLLRIVGFNFESFEKNKKQLTKLLVLMHQMRMPTLICQNIIRLYNDLQYVSIQCWLEGVIYFGYLSTKIGLKLTKSQGFQKQSDQSESNQCEQSRQNNVQNFIVSDQKFEQLFCTSMKSLRKYCQKLILFYQSLQISQKKQKHKSWDKIHNQHALILDQKQLVSQKKQNILQKQGHSLIGHHEITNNFAKQSQKLQQNHFVNQMDLQLIVTQKKEDQNLLEQNQNQNENE